MKKDAKKKETEEVGTTGHTWDGIEEYNNPLPRWWLWILYATIIWGVLYTIAYPAWPMIRGATPGLLGYSTRGQVAAEIEAVNTANATLMTQLAEIDLVALADNTELHGFAVNGGAAIFRANCSQCHGSGAAGTVGYPNLLDDDWLWGGTIDEIAWTIDHGIRNEQSLDARWSEMPAYGDIFTRQEIGAVVNHVLAISGQEHDAALALEGAELFLDNCSACHGDGGEGNRALGAPRLNDAIWLYGGTVEAITQTVTNSRFGVMPAWGTRLNPAEVNAVAAYVHQLGGGE
jgi:cytochrome c oxidase cbb3-type subunit III